MSDASTGPESLDTMFTATVTTDRNSGWICVVMPGSGRQRLHRSGRP